MVITDSHYCDWYIESLFPHLRVPLSQQNIETQEKALEITMRMDSLPVHDINLGVKQIQSLLEILHLELQSFKKGKEAQLEVQAEVWCLKCKSHGHDKDHFPVLPGIVSMQKC